ncbi:hypothetical protein ABZY16_04940 [Streptomyces sp. NPDC006553]|uniref:hypothetical protein n=1 Tax=unclassified Streptomyces TaxID=2593676 RepID=UPI0022566A4A|nr:hypothetical protein [Streptomyces sp. NBC_00233]MCX5232796.1 hypothetical protein [Streptomyces sp. NBC_00233]
MSEDDDTSPVHRLFGLDTVILAEPRRSVLRRYTGPKMHLVADDGRPLAHLQERGTFAYVLHDLDECPVLGVDLVSGRRGFARPAFLMTGPGGDPIGTVRSPGRLHRTRLLDVRTAEGGTLRITRNAPLGRAWRVEDDGGVIAEVTVSTVRSLDGLQGYRVEFDRRARSEQRRLVVGGTVCLQVIRRWLNSPQGNAA